MLQHFFLEQMVNLSHAPFFVFDEGKNLTQRFGANDVKNQIFERNPGLVRKIYEWKNEECPVIFREQELLFSIISGRDGTVIVMGPVMLEAPGREDLIRLRKHFHLGKSSEYRPPTCTLDEVVSGSLLVHWQNTGEKLSIMEFWKRNSKYYADELKVQSRISRDIFRRQENVGLHNPYEQELREQESIERGDVEALGRSISETYEGELGKLARDPLRSHKNIAIGNITLASRAAIRGGVSAEKSFSLADSLIQQVEELDDILAVESFKREAQYEYAKLVSEENAPKSEKGKDGKKAQANPLVGAVKDYVFNHLHGAIQVSDIARDIGVNADYLSHVFRVEESLTITDYVRREKIRRGENLLKYSNYSIQEIAFYLGFCSQSHFSKAFRRITGTTPNTYRKEYGNRKNWKLDKK